MGRWKTPATDADLAVQPGHCRPKGNLTIMLGQKYILPLATYGSETDILRKSRKPV